MSNYRDLLLLPTYAYNEISTESNKDNALIYDHFHYLNEIIICHEGEAQFVIHDKKYTLTEKELIIIGYMESHTVWITKHPYNRSVLSMGTEFMLKYLKEPFLISLLQNHTQDFPYVFALDNEHYKYICNRIEIGIDEFNKQDVYWENEYAYALSSMLISVYRKYSHVISNYVDSKTADIMLQIQSHLSKNYSQNISLTSLSEDFFYSEAYISSQFKKFTGMTVSQFIIRSRLIEAKYQLLNTTKTVQEIGKSVGYENANHFSRIFRAYEAISPTEYRRRGVTKEIFLPNRGKV